MVNILTVTSVAVDKNKTKPKRIITQHIGEYFKKFVFHSEIHGSFWPLSLGKSLQLSPP